MVIDERQPNTGGQGKKKKKAGKVKKCESIIINVEPGSSKTFFSNGKKNW